MFVLRNNRKSIPQYGSIFLLLFSTTFLTFVQNQKSSSNFVKSLNVNKTNYFTKLMNNDSNTRLSMTLAEVNTVYKISQQYAFFIPNVHAECECTCDHKHAVYCSENTRMDQLKCASLSNATTTCTVYNDQGADERLCSNNYKVCCLVYFRKHTAMGRFLAFNLNYYKTVYYFDVVVENQDQNVYNQTIIISEDMNQIQLTPDIVLRISNLRPLHLLEDKWYFASEKSLEILVSSKVNDRSSESLQNIGWFKEKDDGKPSTVARLNLKDNFRLELRNCKTSPPIYKWTLNAINFYHDGLLRFPQDVIPAIEANKNISNISINLLDKIVTIKGKSDLLKNTISVSVERGFQNGHKFIFTSNVKIFNDDHLLKLNFTLGNGEFSGNILSFNLMKFQSFMIRIQNASTDNPSYHQVKIYLKNEHWLWVCLNQDGSVLCQLIEDNTNPEELSTKSTEENNSKYDIIIVILSVTFAFILGMIFTMVFHQRIVRISKYFLKKQHVNESENPEGDTENPLLNNDNQANSHSGEETSFSDTGYHEHSSTNPVYQTGEIPLNIPPVIQTFKNKIHPELWKPFGNQCGLINRELDSLTATADKQNWNYERKTIELLKKIQQKYPNKFNKSFLEESLQECEVWKELEEGQLKSLQDGLRRCYKSNNSLPYFSWMGNIQLDYNDLDFTLTGDEKKNYPLQRIFDENSSRILIQGKAGSGKTCSCLKVCYDWATSKNYLKQFELVFLLHLRLAKNGILNSLLQLLKQNKSEIIIKIIKSVEEKTLFLFDGFDEIPPESKTEFLDFFNGLPFPKAKFLISCRTDTAHLTGVTFDKKFRINQVDMDHVEKFLLKNLFGNNDIFKSQTKTILEQTTQEMRENPLFLLLIGILLKHHGSTLLPKRAELYLNILKFISRSWSPEHENDYSDFSSMLITFGEFALKCLNEGKLTLTEDDVSERNIKPIINFGLVYKCQIDDQTFPTFYKPIHKTVFEYLAASYLWNIRGSIDFKNVIISLTNLELFHLNSSKVFCFLFELLNKETPLLLNALTPYAYNYSLDFNCLWKEIKDCEITDELLNALLPFVGVEWNVLHFQHESGFSLSDLHSKLLHQSLTNDKIKIFRWNAFYSFLSSQKIQVPKANIGITSEISQVNINVSKSIECEEAHFTLFEDSHLLQSQWNNFLAIIKNVKSKCISFEIKSLQEDIYARIVREIENGNLEEVEFRNIYFKCYIHYKSSFSSLSEVVGMKNVHSIFIVLEPCEFEDITLPTEAIDQSTVNSLVTNVSENKGLNEFIFINLSGKSFSIDLQILTNDGQKSFDILWFEGIELNDSKGNHKTVKTLLVYEPLNDTSSVKNALTSMTSTFGGYLSVIHSITEEIPSDNLLNITELDVVITDEIFQNNYFLCIKKFSNLRVLCLGMLHAIKDHSFAEAVKNITEVIGHLQLKTLEISQNKETFPFAFAIGQGLTQLALSSPNNSLENFRLKMNLRLMEEYNDEDVNGTLLTSCGILPYMSQLLQKGRLKTCCFLIHGPYNLRSNEDDMPNALLLSQIFPPKQGFHIEWDVEGRQEGNARHKCLFGHAINIYRLKFTFTPPV